MALSSSSPARASATSPTGHYVIPIVAGIGNALLAVPMVRQLKSALPDSTITILARTRAMAQVFERLPEVSDVHVTGKGVRGIWRNIIVSRRLRADVYLVPFPSNRWQYSLLALASGARRKVLHSYPVGYWRALHFIGERIAAQRGLHDVEQNLNLLTHLDIVPTQDRAPVFPLTDADRAAAAGLLQQACLPQGEQPIIIHAGSAQTILAQAKRWPPESYRQLIARLEAEFNLPVILVEGPDEAGVAAEISSSAKTIKLTGPLAEAAALLERARLYVGSDSGLAHLAAAVGTPAVTLFAPADPDRVAPFGCRDLVVQAPTPCAPCMKYPWHTPYPKICCRDPMCITQITPDTVLQKVRQALQTRDSHHFALKNRDSHHFPQVRS